MGGLPASLLTERPCFVYLIVPADRARPCPVKVGMTASPEARLWAIQTGCPFKVEIEQQWRFPSRLMARHVEEMFHWIYRRRRLYGEWFEMDYVSAIESLDTITFDMLYQRNYDVPDFADWSRYIGITSERLKYYLRYEETVV